MSNRIFFDTNVIVDVYLKRKPNVDIDEELFKYCTSKNFKFCISALTVMNVAYIGKLQKQNIKEFRNFINNFIIIDLEEDLIDWAYRIGLDDFEDAVQYVSAAESNCDYLVTWNTKDYKEVSHLISIVTPKDMLKSLSK